MQLSIELDEMTFYAYHGVLEQERRVGNTFKVRLSIELDSYASLEVDDLNATANYAMIYACVRQEMDRPSQLLEYVTGRIARRLFTDFPIIRALKLSLSKCKPPMVGDITSSTVILSACRGEL